MPLELDVLHKKFVTHNTRHKPSLQENPVLWATSFAPCSDNGLAGKYLCEQFGRELKRKDQMCALARDIQRHATDSNGNPPCINEVFSNGVARFAPFLDFDGASVHFAHVDTDWLKRYAVLVLRVLREVAQPPPANDDRNVAQIVITTTVTEPLGEFRPVEADIYVCPHCPAAEVVERSASAQVFICRECNASWTRVDGGDTSDGEDEECEDGEGLGEDGAIETHFAFRSASRRAPQQQLLPTRKRTRRVGAHFRLQGVLVTPADALEFVRLVRQRSYAFDRKIPMTEWDEALDEGPVARRQLRLTLTHKAAPCSACKGRRAANFECFACFGRGYEVLNNKTYNVLDILFDAPMDSVAELAGRPCEGAGPRPQFLTDVDTDGQHGGAGDIVRNKVRTDFEFVLLLCSISVPIKSARETDFSFNNAFGGVGVGVGVGVRVTAVTPSMPMSCGAGEGGRKRRFLLDETQAVGGATPVPTSTKVWGGSGDQKRPRGAKNFLPPERFELLLAAVVEACPMYADASVRQAFFTNKARRVIVIHLDGPSSTFCLNKLAQGTVARGGGGAGGGGGGRVAGFHRSSRAWATITQADNGVCFIRLRCFSKKRAAHHDTGEECGCGAWKGAVFTIGHQIAAKIFCADARPNGERSGDCGDDGGGGGGGGVTGSLAGVDDIRCVAHNSMFPFLTGFRRKGSLVKFLREVDEVSKTKHPCAFVDALPPDPMKHVLRFLDCAGVRVRLPPSTCSGASMMGTIRRAHAARSQREAANANALTMEVDNI